MELNKGQQDFVDQMTRKLMVEWCYLALQKNLLKEGVCICEAEAVYRDHAVEKKWLSKKNGATGASAILSAGWDTARAFLRR